MITVPWGATARRESKAPFSGSSVLYLVRAKRR
jgi:hypothetical protein